MSEESSQEFAEVEKIAKRIFDALLKAKDHPQLTGMILISAGTLIRQVLPQADFVIFDFGGNHVPPQSAQKAAQSAQAAGKDMPQWIKDLQSYLGFDFGLAEAFLPFGSGVGAVVNPALNAVGINPQAALPNVLSLLGINLPQKITLSEIMILAGILSMAEPLLKAISGSIGSLVSSNLPKFG